MVDAGAEGQILEMPLRVADPVRRGEGEVEPHVVQVAQLAPAAQVRGISLFQPITALLQPLVGEAYIQPELT